MFRCIWQTGELESEYTHKSELSKDSFLFVPELDYEYNNDTDDYFNYDELYELIQASFKPFLFLKLRPVVYGGFNDFDIS